MAIPLLRAEDITKRFSGTVALAGVRFELMPGEVHALMGENGAGKSTLGKILSGVYGKDEGHIFLDEREIDISDTRQAAGHGISIVLQEFNLVGDLSVAENLFLNDKAYYRMGMVNRKKMQADALELLALFGAENTLDPRQKVHTLSIAEMQIIEILKSVKQNSRVLILDEPTAALTSVEAERLFAIVRGLKEKGVGIVIVSHRIEEIFAIGDRVTVLRDGKQMMDARPLKDLTENQLVSAMVGREVNDLYGHRAVGVAADAPVVLEANRLCDTAGRVRNASLQLKKGEILGLTGLVGAGRTELVRCLFGVNPCKGTVAVKGHEMPARYTARASIRRGMAMVPEDRKHDGLLLPVSIQNNMTLAQMGVSRRLVPSQRAEARSSTAMVQDLHIKVGDVRLPVSSLSGGNQQKVLLAKWLMVKPDILIVDEPTRGIDISAKSEIYTILNGLADQGIAILMVSSEMPEIIGMCDRVLVMRDGEIVKELARGEATEETVATHAMMQLA